MNALIDFQCTWLTGNLKNCSINKTLTFNLHNCNKQLKFRYFITTRKKYHFIFGSLWWGFLFYQIILAFLISYTRPIWVNKKPPWNFNIFDIVWLRCKQSDKFYRPIWSLVINFLAEWVSGLFCCAYFTCMVYLWQADIFFCNSKYIIRNIFLIM